MPSAFCSSWPFLAGRADCPSLRSSKRSDLFLTKHEGLDLLFRPSQRLASGQPADGPARLTLSIPSTDTLTKNSFLVSLVDLALWIQHAPGSDFLLTIGLMPIDCQRRSSDRNNDLQWGYRQRHGWPLRPVRKPALSSFSPSWRLSPQWTSEISQIFCLHIFLIAATTSTSDLFLFTHVTCVIIVF